MSAQVRPFISSSFRDMQGEREALMKVAFPSLAKVCSSRGVFFYPVDLRWGITADESGDGKVLDLCLREVDRSRPYFLGMLGNRYGWCQDPEEGVDDLLEKTFEIAQKNFPFLVDYHDRSVTELEIIYGALQTPPEKRKGILFYFLENTSSDSSYSATKMRALKERILEEGFTVKYYANPQQLAELVTEDLTKIIQEDFPVTRIESPLENERQSQLAFAKTRAQVYVGGTKAFEEMNNYLYNSTSTKPLMIIGESGGGKTSLVANYWFQLQRQDVISVAYFIGSTPQSSSHFYLLQYLMENLKEMLHLEEQVPTDLTALVSTFEMWLQLLAPKEGEDPNKVTLVLLLDALNQLDSVDEAQELAWLPVTFPKHVRVIVSSLPGRSLDVLKTRNCPSLTVHPLQPGEKSQLTLEYLQQYSKNLGEAQIERISKSPQTSNALYLRVFLDELRISADFEGLSLKIEAFLEGAPNVEALFEMVLQRWEEDYGTSTVSQALCFLYVSFAGLSEAELLSLLKISQHHLSPLILASQEVIINRSKGLLGYFHDNLRIAVRSRYLPTRESQIPYRLRLVDYFEALDFENEDHLQRKVTELPYQYNELKDLEKLKEFVGKREVFDSLYTSSRKLDLLRYWRQVGGYDLAVPVYLQALETFKHISGEVPETQADLINFMERLGSFLTDIGKYTESVAVYQEAISQQTKFYGPGHLSTAYTLFKLSTAKDYLCIDWTPETMQGIQIVEAKLGSDHFDLVKPLVSSTYHNYKVSNFEGTIHQLERALTITTPKLAQHPEVHIYTLVTFGQVYFGKKLYEKSMESYRQVMDLTNAKLGPRHRFIGYALRGLALNYRRVSKNQEAEDYFRKAVEFNQETVGPEHPDTGTCLFDFGGMLMDLKKYDDALFSLQKSLEIRQKAFGMNSKKAANTWLQISKCYGYMKKEEEKRQAKEASDAIWQHYNEEAHHA